MESSVKRTYFSYPPEIMRNLVRMRCSFFFFNRGKYRKERIKDIGRTLSKVKKYNGFIQQKGKVTEVYIATIIF